MNSVFRFLMLAALALTFTVVSFAQDPCTDYDAQKALYAKFTDLYPKTALADRKAAVAVAKEYIEKYGSCEGAKAQIDYFKGYIPPVEEQIKKDEVQGVFDARNARFDAAMKAKNFDEAYAAGKEIIANPQPVFANAKGQKYDLPLDVAISLGSIGLDESAKNPSNTKYNADTIKYAQMAIELINSGRSSSFYGLGYPGLPYQYLNEKFPDGKNNALGWMNYNIAYLKFYVDKSDAAKKESIPYFYKVTQLNSPKKNRPEVYFAIGSVYYSELKRLEDDRQAKLKANNPDEKDQKKWKDTDETKQIFALEKGYADRVLDAYSRVYNVIGTTPAEKTLKDSTYNDLKSVYEFRFQGKEKALDALIASTKSKPLPDPSTPVTPVVEVEPTPATTTTTGATGTTTTPATTPATTTTPAVKPATTTTKPAATTPAATKPATAAKPAPKKTNPKR